MLWVGRGLRMNDVGGGFDVDTKGEGQARPATIPERPSALSTKPSGRPGCFSESPGGH